MKSLEAAEQHLDEFMDAAIDSWRQEGHIDSMQAQDLKSTLNLPEIRRGLLHAAGHVAISMPLPFPFGVIARFCYTAGLRLRAEVSALVRRTDPTDDRRTHTFLVMLLALVPGFGRLAYFASPALAEHRLLLVIPMDRMARKLPLRIYERYHLSAMFVYWASEKEGNGAKLDLANAKAYVAERLHGLSPYLAPLSAVLALDATLFVIGTAIYLDSDRASIWWFDERGVIAMLDVSQLLVAAFAGITAYQVFWRPPLRNATPAEAAGIFLWGFGGIGLLIFAADDFFSVHENVGDVALSQFAFLPRVTNSLDDLLILGYAVVGIVAVFIFRMELTAPRNSTTLLQLGVLASIVMVLTDAFAFTTALKALELPTQTFAVTILMFAFLARLSEVKSSVQVHNPNASQKVATR